MAPSEWNPAGPDAPSSPPQLPSLLELSGFISLEQFQHDQKFLVVTVRCTRGKTAGWIHKNRKKNFTSPNDDVFGTDFSLCQTKIDGN